MAAPALNRLDFNLLLDLDALLREGSVVGAARQLNVSAPAMSRRLTRLREAVGDPLFVPAGRGLVPTRRALALRARVQAAIEEVRGVFTPEEVDFSTLQRTFTLRANDSFLGGWATRLAAAMTAEAPGVSLHFMLRADKDIDPLRNGLIDLDIGVAGPQEAEIYRQLLFKASFVGVVREGHPMLRHTGKGQGKKTAGVSAKDFAAWPHVAAPRSVHAGGHAGGRIDAALKALGLERKVLIVAPGFQAALAMVAASDLVTAVPEPVARWAMAHQRLEAFKLPVKIPGMDVTQTWHLRHHADPVHVWLRQHVHAVCQTMP
ncbi:MAG: LysR family transcriptional regulator [Polaromonas sp.]